MHAYRISSDLVAAPEAVWEFVTSMAGVNQEMMPLVRMTIPAALRDTRIDDLAPGRPVGRSWLLLFGVIPADFDDLTIAERGPGRRFLERSTMLTQSCWEHERTVAEIDGGCRVTDRLNWQGRIPGLGAIYRLAVPLLFRHRHSRLRRRFGALSTESRPSYD